MIFQMVFRNQFFNRNRTLQLDNLLILGACETLIRVGWVSPISVSRFLMQSNIFSWFKFLEAYDSYGSTWLAFRSRYILSRKHVVPSHSDSMDLHVVLRCSYVGMNVIRSAFTLSTVWSTRNENNRKLWANVCSTQSDLTYDLEAAYFLFF
jgi:hypothetical protein